MQLDGLGEFEVIARLTKDIPPRPDVLIGIGDDAAVLDFGALGPDMALVATCDSQVAGRHFLLDEATPEAIGHKALAVNLSDIAAMGARPLWALVSLLAPPSLAVDTLHGAYAGLRALADTFGVAIVGGNVAATDGPLTIDVTLLGACPRGGALTRTGGRPGDLVMVTGTLGAAAAGLLVADGATSFGTLSASMLHSARQAQTRPQPRVAEGSALARTGVVTAMLDVSDGLAADLGHLCEASEVGAQLDSAAVPVDGAAVAIGAAVGRDPLALALTGGEDYELLFTVRPGAAERALAAVAQVRGVATVIGRLTEQSAGMTIQYPDGRSVALEPQGWDHLRPNAATDRPPH